MRLHVKVEGCDQEYMYYSHAQFLQERKKIGDKFTVKIYKGLKEMCTQHWEHVERNPKNAQSK